MVIAIPAQAEVTRLQWGTHHSAAKKSTDTQSALRFVKPAVATSSHSDSHNNTDSIIRLTAYESGDAPRLTSGRETAPASRSVVVSRESDAEDGFRSAQLPSTNTGADATTNPSGSQNSKIEDGLRSPFSDSEEPPQPNPLPMPESSAAPPLPPPENNPNILPEERKQLLQLQAPPGPSQFHPVLPSGPSSDLSPPAPPAATEPSIKEEGAKAEESCEKSLQNLRDYTVNKVDLDIAIHGTAGQDYPFECSLDDGSMHVGRCWDQTTYMWKASALCHKPLYFEDEQLERYGHSFSPCFQPFVSGAHFFTHVPILPYCMGVEPPCECVYSLGHYRPGDCAPYMCNPIPLSLRGALFQGGAVVGAAAAIP